MPFETDYSDEYFTEYLNKMEEKSISKKYYKIKHKVLIIPYILVKNELKFLIVKDKKFNEWTFISGMVEKKESHFNAGRRELFEETKKLINIQPSESNCIYFETKLYENNIKYVYHVQLVDIKKFGYIDSERIIKSFRSTKLTEKKYNENLDIDFKTFSEINKLSNVWAFIRTHILDNFFFEKTINELS